jgi:hypothetical protein
LQKSNSQVEVNRTILNESEVIKKKNLFKKYG